MRYTYTGIEDVHLPSQGLLVHPGQVIEAQEIIHPDFTPVYDTSETPSQSEEQTEE